MSPHEEVAIFWDYENCRAPSNLPGHAIVNSIRDIAHEFGVITTFKAYLDLSEPVPSKSPGIRSELQSSGVSLIDCPHNGRKDVADKMMIVDMLAYAIDRPPPATVVVISGDRDFAYAISVLRLRRYRLAVIAPSTNGHCSLKYLASRVVDWDSEVIKKTTPPVRIIVPSPTTLASAIIASQRFELSAAPNVPPVGVLTCPVSATAPVCRSESRLQEDEWPKPTAESLNIDNSENGELDDSVTCTERVMVSTASQTQNDNHLSDSDHSRDGGQSTSACDMVQPRSRSLSTLSFMESINTHTSGRYRNSSNPGGADSDWHAALSDVGTTTYLSTQSTPTLSPMRLQFDRSALILRGRGFDKDAEVPHLDIGEGISIPANPCIPSDSPSNSGELQDEVEENATRSTVDGSPIVPTLLLGGTENKAYLVSVDCVDATTSLPQLMSISPVLSSNGPTSDSPRLTVEQHSCTPEANSDNPERPVQKESTLGLVQVGAELAPVQREEDRYHGKLEVQKGLPSVVPSRYAALVEVLVESHKKGFTRPLYGNVAERLLRRNQWVYEDAGFRRLKDYVASAAKDGLVEHGGVTGQEWVSLHPTLIGKLQGKEGQNLQPLTKCNESDPIIAPLSESSVSLLGAIISAEVVGSTEQNLTFHGHETVQRTSQPDPISTTYLSQKFKVLTDILQGVKGQARLSFSQIAIEVKKRDPYAYQRVGAGRFKDYAMMAVKEGVVQYSGQGPGKEWLSLNKS